jgi:hypothetical protein
VDASGVITTVAGNGNWGYSGDGGSATNATLNWPDGLAVDGQGNLYIADGCNGVIRKVDASGVITTVAGNGSWGYTGDGGFATNATLNWLGGIAVDGSGNLYIADTDNSVIRKVDVSGVITTLAGNNSLGGGYSGDGGAAANAALNWPSGVEVDGSGHLYIADAGNSVIRAVTSNYSIDSDGALTIYNAQAGQAGYYQLVVSNAYGGSITSSPAALAVDPNIIHFSIEVTNNYVNTSYASLQLNVTAGVPGYYAVLVDGTNFAGATWTAYTSSNITANLGTQEGWHGLWIGLKGFTADAQQTWLWKGLELVTTQPQLVITSPTNANGLVNVPLVQVAGFCTEPLDSISYDLTNALGLVTNQDAGITHQYYDTNTFNFTTNYFECVDVPLTNGLNIITLHAIDLAGNMTTLATNITLDYSGTTNPAIQLFWPQNGEQISGSSFTWRGWVDDPTATIFASIVDTNGNTSVVQGLVERNGNFWVEDLPMPNGTNSLTLTVTNAAGYSSSTNITVSTSPLTVTMTPIPDGQLWNATVTATGSISDSTYSLWINGVKAGVTNGVWTANNVPMTPGGVATFDITCYAPGEVQPDNSTGNGN